MKTIVLLFTLLISSLGVAQEESATTPQIGINVSLGDSITIDGVTITFSEVLEDSRCPSDVTCVWAGQAKVKVDVSGGGVTQDSVELLFGSKGNLRIANIDNFYLEAMALTPYPTSETQGKLAYTLIVRKVMKE